MTQKDSAEKVVRDIRRKTRRKFSAEEKIRIVLENSRGEESGTSPCRRASACCLGERRDIDRHESLKRRVSMYPRTLCQGGSTSRVRPPGAVHSHVLALVVSLLVPRALQAALHPNGHREDVIWITAILNDASIDLLM